MDHFRTVVTRIEELSRLASRAKELGYSPKDGICFTTEELDELFEERKLIQPVDVILEKSNG